MALVNPVTHCPICGKGRYKHTCLEAAECRAKMKKNDKFLVRKYFPESVKRQVLKDQKGLCAACHEYMIQVEFHHRNGRSDNSHENCVALHLGCHRDITHGRREL